VAIFGLRGLTNGGARWVVAPMLAVLTVAVLGGFSSAANAATPAVSVTGVGTTSPVLRQAGSGWQTTVLVTDTGADTGCVQGTAVQYWLATRPYGVIMQQGVPGRPGTVAGTAPDANACEVTITFSNVAHVPTTAALIVDQSGASTAVTLTVSRDVTLGSYLLFPASAGGILVVIYLLSLLFLVTYDWQGNRYHLFRRAWWKQPIAGSGAWSSGDSWATNITTGLVVVTTFLAATTASSALFPGVALDRFAMVNIVAGVFVVAAPVVFGILYAFFTGRYPGPSADSSVRVPPEKRVILRVPSGAAVTTMKTASSGLTGEAATENDAGPYQIPPGSVISIMTPTPTAGVKTIAFSGTSDIGVLPGATVGAGAEPPGKWAPADLPVLPALPVSTRGGLKITVTGTADVYLPEKSVITGPRRKDGRPVSADGRWLLLPQGSTLIIGSLGVMIAANIFTLFGIGAELGIAFVLTDFSEATGGWSNFIYAGLAALTSLVFWYAVSATRAMARPQPGSSLSAEAGTSFTL
jgi:hypothetical protein